MFHSVMDSLLKENTDWELLFLYFLFSEFQFFSPEKTRGMGKPSIVAFRFVCVWTSNMTSEILMLVSGAACRPDTLIFFLS